MLAVRRAGMCCRLGITEARLNVISPEEYPAFSGLPYAN
jgi:hypothetical protein